MEALAKHIDGLKTKYDEEAKALDSWTQSVAQAQSTYEKLTTEFSETLMTDTLTGKQLTDREKEDLEAYGQGIGDALVEGLNKAQARDLTFLDMLIGNAESVEESDGIALGAELINARYGRLLEEAGALGEALRQQMADAMADGIITEEERDEIVNNTIEAMNQIQAQIDARMDAQRRWEAIGRAQNVSWDSMSGYLEYMEKSLDERLAAVDERYAGEYGQVMAAFDDALKTGKPLEVNGEMITVTEADRDKVAQPILDAWERAKQAEYDLYGKEAATAFTALMHDSGAAGAWDFLNDANANGKPDYDAFDWSDFKTADLERLDEQFRVLQEVSGAALKFVPESSKYYEEIAGLLGQAAKAQEMLEHEIESRSLQATQTPVGMDEYGRTLSGADYYDTLDSLDELEQIKRNLNSAIEAKGWQNASGEIADWFAVNDRMDALEDQGTQFETLEREESAWWNDYYTGTTQMAKLRKELDAVEQEIARTEERISSKGDYRDWWYTFSNGQLRDEIKLTGVDGSGGLYARRESLTSQIAELETTATGGTEAVSAAVEEMQAAADASGGVDVGIRANGGYEAMSEQLALMQAEADRGVRVRVFTLGGAGKVTAETYAEGGRATEPSIFAEGDTAEWAIPEAHTERTRQLLIQAAKASGFDWDELLSARGGLNGDAQNVTVNTTYAPTINAGDASGVDNVLNGDKARFAHIVREAVRAALADQRLRDQVEVYV